MNRAVLVVPALALAAGIGTVARGSATEGRPQAPDRSGALAQGSAGDVLADDSVVVPAALARVVAEDLAAEVPLPTGGTFDGIRWEQLGSAVSRHEIAGMLQYNAACQWLRAWRDGREAAVAHAVLADVPRWPAWRGTATGAALADVAANGGGETATTMLADCDASHEREQRYATALGLSPSR